MTTTTLRLPDDIAQAVKTEAAALRTSVNGLVLELIQSHLKSKEEEALYNGFTLLGNDPEACDVEYAIHAASEVVHTDD